MNTCRTRFFEQFIVQYVVAISIVHDLDQSGDSIAPDKSHIVAALAAATLAWDSLEIVKATPECRDQFTDLKWVFETMRL